MTPRIPPSFQRLYRKWHRQTQAIILPVGNWLSRSWEAHQERSLSCRPKPSASPLVLLIAVTSITGIMGHRFYNQPALSVGRIAPRTILALEDASVVDEQSTEEKRKAARTGAIPVLKMDNQVNQQIYQDLQRILAQGSELRALLGEFPIVPLSQISATTQLFIRNLSDAEWSALRREALQSGAVDSDVSDLALPDPEALPSLTQVQSSLQRRQAIAELQQYRQRNPNRNFNEILQQFSTARQRYQSVLTQLETLEPAQGGGLYDANFLNLMPQSWQGLQTGLYAALERMLIQGFAPGTPPEILEQAIRLQVNLAVPPAAEPLGIELLLAVIQPNLVVDPEATKLQAEQAAEAVDPVVVSINNGEVIVKAGETINQSQFVLLDHFQRSERSVNWLGLLGYSGVVFVCTGLFWVTVQRIPFRLTRRDYFLVLLLVLSTPSLLLLNLNTTTLPAVGILMGTFYGPTLGTLTILLQAVLLPLGMKIEIDLLLSGVIGGCFAAIVSHFLRSREEMALLGAGVGFIQGTTHLISSLVLSSAAGQVWYSLARIAAWYALEAIAWCIVALGLSPYLEHLFDLITPIRLSELSNPNRALLQRLATVTPGTFQHTLFVASLAEAAARELKANIELVRAGTLYHDIGKMHDPQGFIENQIGGPNKHDQLNNPWKSAEIIRKHVTEGLGMARKCRLPRALQAFIPEHQGTMLISYFYHQAQQLTKDYPDRYPNPINEADFRYPGPIPQSRETGIVMLADSCEAALRSLKDATTEEALAMVIKIIRARWQEQQLVDSGLKREDMDTIAQVFVATWQQFHHKRIPYPSTATTPSESSVYRVPIAP